MVELQIVILAVAGSSPVGRPVFCQNTDSDLAESKACMKAFNFAALVLLSALGMGTSRASLGDTEAQCVAKYGSESDVTDGLGYGVAGDRAVTFSLKTASGPLILRVVLLQGTVGHEGISSADPSHPLSQERMKALLDAESAGLKWRKGNSVFHTENSFSAGSTSGVVNWSRSDGAIAKFWVSGKARSQDLSGQMELSTKRFADTQAFFDKRDGTN